MTDETVTASVNLGKEYDEALHMAVLAVPHDIGATRIETTNGIAGSQELARLVVDVCGERITVESETFIGVTISGPAPLVERLVELMRCKRSD